ncbi:MAG: RNA polymerase sigma-54 factor, partial [Candidatus Cloacimonetes bacterium]|nr:RNA polymerase sigma-54 factor [Candidatus Cloacimonadota bacterium]
TKAGKDNDYSPVSKQNVQFQLKKIIDDEDQSSPFSDHELTSILKERGIGVSRRLVTKYRESLGILNSRLRKKA